MKTRQYLVGIIAIRDVMVVRRSPNGHLITVLSRDTGKTSAFRMLIRSLPRARIMSDEWRPPGSTKGRPGLGSWGSAQAYNRPSASADFSAF
jgi:hypothetical protein